jgi:hypothetical protein
LARVPPGHRRATIPGRCSSRAGRRGLSRLVNPRRARGEVGNARTSRHASGDAVVFRPSGRATSLVCTARSVSAAAGPVPGGAYWLSMLARRIATSSLVGRSAICRDILTEYLWKLPASSPPRKNFSRLSQNGPIR